MGLGSTIKDLEATLGPYKVISFSVIFSITMPLGIVVGIILSLQEENKEEGNVIKGKSSLVV